MSVEGITDKTLNNQAALSLLTDNSFDFSNMTPEEATRLDFIGKDTLSLGEEYINRVLAARGFEANAMKEEAGFSYDRAARVAESLGYISSAIKCRIRACRLWNSIDRAEYREKASEHLLSIINNYSDEDLTNGAKPFPDDHPFIRSRNRKKSVERVISERNKSFYGEGWIQRRARRKR